MSDALPSADDQATEHLRKEFAEGEALAALCGLFGISEAVCLEVLISTRSIGGKRPARADRYQTAIDDRFVIEYLDAEGSRR